MNISLLESEFSVFEAFTLGWLPLIPSQMLNSTMTYMLRLRRTFATGNENNEETFQSCVSILCFQLTTSGVNLIEKVKYVFD